jgi:hypothetical protein
MNMGEVLSRPVRYLPMVGKLKAGFTTHRSVFVLPKNEYGRVFSPTYIHFSEFAPSPLGRAGVGSLWAYNSILVVDGLILLACVLPALTPALLYSALEWGAMERIRSDNLLLTITYMDFNIIVLSLTDR